jgi:hypothetical protein
MKLLLTVVEEIDMWKVARPTQANGGLEWGTQHLFMPDGAGTRSPDPFIIGANLLAPLIVFAVG